jgi:hypothetical protein
MGNFFGEIKEKKVDDQQKIKGEKKFNDHKKILLLGTGIFKKIKIKKVVAE